MVGIETKSIKSRVWIYSHMDNKNTQRHFKTNIKELTQDHTSGNFLKRFLGDLMGLKGALFQNPPIRFKKYHKIKINYQKA
ncbi:hypothetical protein yangon129_03050 [Helicobacter pylori]